jgi:hypothetical protein
MPNVMDAILTIVMAVILVVTVAVPILKGANQVTWTTDEKTLYGNNSLFLFLGLLYLIARVFILGSYGKNPMTLKALSPPI